MHMINLICFLIFQNSIILPTILTPRCKYHIFIHSEFCCFYWTHAIPSSAQHIRFRDYSRSMMFQIVQTHIILLIPDILLKATMKCLYFFLEKTTSLLLEFHKIALIFLVVAKHLMSYLVIVTMDCNKVQIPIESLLIDFVYLYLVLGENIFAQTT